MAKYVIETVQVVKATYYIEVNDPSWAHDGIVMNELEPFAREFFCEDISGTRVVDQWPRMPHDTVNAATNSYNYETESWDQQVRWDLAE